MKIKKLGPFLGENNRLPEFSLHVDKVGDFLRSTLNIDIDNHGNIRRRKATKKVLSLVGSHSLHMYSETNGYVMVLNGMYPITVAGESVTVGALFKILSGPDPVHWLQNGADLYYSNGTVSGRITGGAHFPIGLATPGAPGIAPIAGSLPPGRYQVSVSYSNSITGEESGISPSSEIELAAAGGIRATLPAPHDGATTINTYLSTTNGPIPYLHGGVAVGTASYDMTILATGREGYERFESVLPAGRLFMSNQRLCSISGNLVYIGLPYRYGYYRPAEGYIPFPAPVTIAIENQNGTYVAADKTYWIPGDIGDTQGALQDVLPYGAVPGTEFMSPDRSICGWFSAEGVVFGTTGGEVEAVMSENIEQVAPASGVAAILESNGISRVVSCGWCVNLDNKAATRYADWGFTSVSGGLGTKDDGIYLLEANGPVDASAGFGKLDFSSEKLNRIPSVYIGVASECQMNLSVSYIDEVKGLCEFNYKARNAGEHLSVRRFDIGRGIRATWLDLTISNSEGSDFIMASISPMTAVSSRKI